MARDLEVAILFADVVGSTQLYDKFGDTKASETVAVCLDVMKEATHQYNGTVIKTIGDEVMSTFPSVDEAMGAAVLMQSRISAESRDCIRTAAPIASSTDGNVDITSSPIVLMTVPLNW